LDAPLPNSSIEHRLGPMVVIITRYNLFVTSQYDVIFTFATNILEKFVDTTCIFRDAGAAAGRAVKILREMETSKKNKKLLPITFVSVHQQC